jgi:hypothetical protein
MDSDVQPRVAILIDGDHTPVNILEDIESHAQAFGEIVQRRVYGLDDHMNSWQRAKCYAPVATEVGKSAAEGGLNATDFVLSMDAVELAAKGEVDVMVICAGDSDYVHLARKLASMGIETQGVGIGQPSAALQAHMDGYLCISYRSRRKIGIAAMLESMERGDLSGDESREAKIAGLARDLLYQSGGPDGLALKSLCVYMHSTYGISKDDLPGKSWREFLALYSEDFALVGEGDNTQVSLLCGEVSPSGWKNGLLIDRLIRQLLRKRGRDGEMMAVELAALMDELYGVTAENLPTRRWSTYLESKSEQFELLTDGPGLSVRMRVPETEPEPLP